MIRRPVLAIATVVVAGVAALAVADPFHLLVTPWFAGIAVGVAAVLLTCWLVLVTGRRLVRGLVAVAGLLAVLVWGTFTWASIVISPGLAVVREVPGPPTSRLRLAIVEVESFAVDGPTYSVRLRAGSGLLLQDSPVWVGLGDGGGCGYRSTVDPVTLAVDPVHRPLRLDGC